MTNRYEMKLKMLEMLLIFLEKFFDYLRPLPMAESLIQNLRYDIRSIRKLAEEQALKKTGVALEKEKIKKEVTGLAYDLSLKIAAFAKFGNNTILLEEVSRTKSDFDRYTDTAIINNFNALLSRAKTYEPQLASYKIDAESISHFEDALNKFKVSVTQPLENRNAIKKNNREIKEYFAKADETLRDIDTMMGIIRQSEPGIFEEYKTARQVNEFPGIGLSVKGKVVETITSTPLAWVTLRLRFLENGGGKEIVHKSAAGGGFHLKNLQPGEYKLIATFPGYVAKETTIAVSSGNLTRLVVEMEKNPVK